MQVLQGDCVNLLGSFPYPRRKLHAPTFLISLRNGELIQLGALLTQPQCNGLKPCQTCSKRNLHCTYGEVDTPSDHDLQSSPKRRMVESQSPLGMVDPLTGSEKETLSLNVAPPPPPPPARWTPTKDSFQPPANGNSGAPISNVRASGFSMSLLLNDENVKKEHKSALNVPPSISRGLGLMSRGSTVSGQEEEAVVYSNTRMLQDPTGRLCQCSPVLRRG